MTENTIVESEMSPYRNHPDHRGNANDGILHDRFYQNKKGSIQLPCKNFVCENKMLTNIEYVEIVRQREKAQINT
jgi:hypothetical protein